MGYFLNPVPVRIKLSDNPSVRELLLAVQKVSAGALSNDDVPFQYIVEALKPAADPSRNPFFQVAASLEPSMPAVDPSWNLTPMDIESGGSRWDLYLVWDDRPNGFIGRVQFNPDLFSAATITKLLDDQEALLHEITLHPNSRLSALTHK
jgi:non-ribosomal peptide synthetase component F